ncbi:MAG: HAMP domain-containing protein [Deltaproteobacteria bacterium]|nr:HAMP domain-containing protein [Deltaproteobacteria bacterium]
MAPLNRPLSIRAGVLVQLVLVAAASLALVAVFALKAVGVALERRHAEAGVTVAEVVRRAVQNDFASGKFSPASSRPDLAGYLTPYIRGIDLLPEGPPDGRPAVVPVGKKVFALLSISPTVDVTLPFSLPEPVPGGAPGDRVRGMRVRFHSSGIAEEVRTLVNVTMVLAAIDVGVLVLFGGFLLDRSVIAPVRRLAATSEKIAAGEYELRAEGVEGNEIGQLAASFNKMVDGILEAKERSRRSELEAFRSDKLATVGRLAAGVAHEVGSPLMAIRGYAEHLLRHRPGREETDECLGKVVEETRKMEQIVRGLLSVASPAGGREGATDVNAVVRRTVEMLSFRNLFREVEVRLELDDVPGAAILEDRFRQVLLNLAINAVDAMSGKGRMTVRTWVMEGWNPGHGQALRRRSTDPPGMDGIPLRAAGARAGSGVALSVSDTGSGIRPEDLPLVFDPFFTTKDPGKGTGLGLSVSRTIVESAGGEIRAESVEGGGATFVVVLPPARREAAMHEEGGKDG